MEGKAGKVKGTGKKREGEGWKGKMNKKAGGGERWKVREGKKEGKVGGREMESKLSKGKEGKF